MAANVTSKSPKGQPRAAANNKVAKAQEAARKADAMMGAGAAQPEAVAPQAPPITAPSFGANEPDVGVFLKHVNLIRRKDEEVEGAKLVLKNFKKQMKDLRNQAKAEGIVLGELDQALEDVETETVDLVARQRRYNLYLEWLGKPLNFQPELPGTQPTDTERDQMTWFGRGDQAGRLGKPRDLPDGIPGAFVQDFLKGWDHGQDLLMRSSPLTDRAFKPKGGVQAAAQDNGKILQLGPEHFQSGIDLDEANLSTLLDGHKEAFWNAEIVTVVFGGLKRIVKEPGYIDDGKPETDFTEAMPADVKLAVEEETHFPHAHPDPEAAVEAAEFS